MVSISAMDAALAVIAEAGPIPKAVHAVITETADNLLTPSRKRIGKMDAMSNKLSPAADGMQINNI